MVVGLSLASVEGADVACDRFWGAGLERLVGVALSDDCVDRD